MIRPYLADQLLTRLQQSDLKEAKTLAIAADKNVPYDHVARAISPRAKPVSIKWV